MAPRFWTLFGLVAGALANECVDSDTWYFKKEAKDCAWVAKKSSKNCSSPAFFFLYARSRCLRTGKKESKLKAKVACAETCEDGAADSSTWYAKKAERDCAWVAGKSKRCKKNGKDPAESACAATCGTCDDGGGGVCADDEAWYWKKAGNTCGWLAAGEAEAGRCDKTGSTGETGRAACGVACGPARCAADGERCGGACPVVLGDAAACPAGYAPVTTLPRCRAALAELSLAGWAYETEDEGDWPAGCYHFEPYGVWFNAHATGGAGEDDTRRVCAAAGWGEDVDVLFVGDSDMDNWSTSRVADSVNVAVGGYRCKNVKNEIGALLAAFTPKTVSIVCGENDLAYDDSPATADGRMGAILDAVLASPGASKVVAWGCKPEPDTTGLHDAYREYDALLRARALDSNRLLTFVDVYSAFEDLGNPDSLYAADELHLSAEGYALWNAWSDVALPDDDCAIWKAGTCEAWHATR